jgi:hypothetical protein
MICHFSTLPRRGEPSAVEHPGCARCPLAEVCPRARVLRLGPGGPGEAVRVFESDWDRVDAARMQADAAGIGDCVSVHHTAVLDLVCSSR